MNVAEVTIDAIAAGGDGIARAGELVVFVPRSAPADHARIRFETRRRFARGMIEELITPSPHRVEPPCRHYRVDRCGGCQIQHLRYSAQLEAKQGIVRDALTRIGKRSVDRPSVEPSPQEWRYRRKLTLALRRRRVSDDWTIGLHRFDDPVGVFQLEDCPITDERVMAIWREVMSARAQLPSTDELRASVQLAESGASILVEGGNEWSGRRSFFEAVPSATALWWRPVNRARQLVAERAGGASASGSGADASAEEVTGAGQHFEGAFFAVNGQGAVENARGGGHLPLHGVDDGQAKPPRRVGELRQYVGVRGFDC